MGNVANITIWKKMAVSLYKVIVRHNLQHCLHTWGQFRKKDIETVLKIQKGSEQLN